MTLQGLHLHIDCASGAAGDMMLGALLDLGVPIDVVGNALDAIGAGRGRLRITNVVKAGIAAVDLKVETASPLGPSPGPHAHEHEHEHDDDHAHDHEHEHDHDHDHEHAHSRDHSHDFGMSPDDERWPVRADAHVRDRGARHDHAVHAQATGAPAQDHGSDDHGSYDHGVHAQAAGAPAQDHGSDAHGSHAHGSHAHGSHAHGSHAHGSHDHGDHAPPANVSAHAHGSDDHGVPAHPPGSAHVHGAHAHHHYAEIRGRIATADLTAGTRRRALDIFDRIARAEATLHGTTVDAVAFHEVGAIDSIVDVVGTAAALDWLAPASVSCTSVAMGHGTITCAHGVLPVPAPAALEVLREAGGVMTDGGLARELCTPTGAAILAATVTAWTASPTGRPIAVGWGAGDADLADRPNVVRVCALALGGATASTETVWQVDANLDDMSPELCGPASDAVFAAGALDVWWTPITMKKGRPALTFSALAPDALRGAVIAAILRETTTIGVRYSPRERTVLARSTVSVATRYGTLPIKVASDGTTVRNAAPEYEACAAAARTHGVPVKVVFAAALAAYMGTV